MSKLFFIDLKKKLNCYIIMKKILGLDLGTNSIGWALIENNNILGMGSRIFPEGVYVVK